MDPIYLTSLSSPSDSDLQKMVESISKIEPLLIQGLVRVPELRELAAHADAVYESNVDKNSVQYRKYDKARRSGTRWTPVRNNGYAEPADGAQLLELKQQIIELLNLHQVNITVEPEEVFLPPNSPFTGRVALKNVLSRAGSTIDIKDDYLFSANKTTKNIELLVVLQQYLDTSLGIKARLLGSSAEPPSLTLSDIKAFLTQHPSAKIMGYSHSATGERQTHDRFIIIDGKEVFKVGTSAKDLGITMAQSNIDKINDTGVTGQYIKQFDEWWSHASSYTGLT